ncbi:MAG: MFS transporter [Halofilum sp. (in: g-proteobacteria)]|nr:MFS transporter [Halofilum sp. (in: g-proteobacteria)]
MPRLRVFVFFVGGFFLSYLYRTVNAVLAPDLVAGFGLRADQLGLLTSVFLLAFAGFQPVLGVLLDRFGPRRVESALLLVAAGGALLFAAAEDVTDLLLGRALIGVGVSACLMAGLQANALWFSGPRLALINGLFLAIGGLGAVSAGAPVELALTFTDWRGVLRAVAGITLALALAQFLFIPERTAHDRPTGLRELLEGLRQICTSRLFWQVAPLTMLSQGSALAFHGLWAGPWLADVADLGRLAIATHLSTLSASMVAGFFLTGVATERLGRVGLTPKQVAGGAMALFIVVQVLIVAWPHGPTLWLWAAYGLFGTAGIITYTTLTQHFGVAMAGRANTASTLTVFGCAFLLQAGTGLLLEPFALAEPGHYAADGHRLAMALTIALQLLALAWYVGFRAGGRPGPPVGGDPAPRV